MKTFQTHFKLISDKIYISEIFLRTCDLDEFIDSKAEKNEKFKYFIYSSFGTKKARFFEYEWVIQAIDSGDFLPEKGKILRMLKEAKDNYQKGAYTTFELQCLFMISYKRHSRFCSYYYDLGLDLQRVNSYGKTHAIINTALNIKRQEHGLIKSMFDILKDLDFTSLTIPLNSEKYFFTLLASAEKNGIEKTILHGLKGRKSNNEKINKAVGELIMYLARNANKISHREVTDQVNSVLLSSPKLNGAKTITRKSLSRFLSSPSNKNLINYKRTSKKFFEENILPYLPLENAIKPHDQYQMDGTKLQFACKDDQGHVTSLWLMYVLDSYSRRIMGYAVGLTENSELAVEAFKMALLGGLKKLPHEVVVDNATAFKGEFTKVIQQTEAMGVHWVKTSNPRRKGLIERNIMTLQKVVFNSYFGYIGEGIKSKNENARPNEDVLLLLRDPEYLRNQKQLESLVDEMIAKYNHHSLRENDLSPVETYRQAVPNDLRKIAEHELMFMTGLKFTRKVSKSTIGIVHEKRERVYNTYNTDLVLATNGIYVDVYIDLGQDSKAFIFTKDTNQYIGAFELRQRTHRARINRTSVDLASFKRHAKDKRKLSKELEEKTKEIDKNLKNELGVLPDELLTYKLDSKEEMAQRELDLVLGNQKNAEPTQVDLHDVDPNKKSKRKKRKGSDTRSPMKSNQQLRKKGSRKKLQ